MTISCSSNIPVATQHTNSFLFEREISFLCKSGEGFCLLSKTERIISGVSLDIADTSVTNVADKTVVIKANIKFFFMLIP